MSFELKLSSLCKEERNDVLKTFTVKGAKTQYEPNPPRYDCFLADSENDSLRLPLGMKKKYIEKQEGIVQKEYPKMNEGAKFVKELFTIKTDPNKRKRDQDVVASLALERLKKNDVVFISCFTGYGKSSTAIYLSIVLGMKTMVMCHLKIVREQWVEEFISFTGNTVKIQFLKGKNVKLNPTADVYIVGINKASKMDKEDFEDIGTVIIDEAHIATVTAFTKSLFKFRPKKLIGLSATPDRSDGLHSIFNLYFGSPTDFIIRKEIKNFTVYKYQTKFKPDIEYTTFKGRVTVNWNSVIKSIEENNERWVLIADIVANHPDEKIIILCNRNCLAIGIHNLLINRGERAALLIQNKVKPKEEDNIRVIVSSFKKCGVGFNDPNLTMAIIASDTQDVRQYEGRIRTTDNIIYHIVDDYKTFETHYKECEKWYLSKGATIKVIGVEHNIKSKKNGISSKRFLSLSQ